MFERIIRLLAEWDRHEPSASLLMLVVAVLLFGTTFVRSNNEWSQPWLELGRLFSALLNALVFVGLLATFYFLLDTAYRDFLPLGRSMGSDEETAKEIALAQRIWGNYVVQKELSVEHTVTRKTVVAVASSTGETLYLNQTNVEDIKQESIIGFNGFVDIRLVDFHLNTYVADARYEYDVINYSDSETTAQFQFPLDSSHYYENLRITVDGKELGEEKKIGSGRIDWTLNMAPQQTRRIVVSYSVRGMGTFYYRVPIQHTIEDFSLAIRTNSPSFYTYANPSEEAIKKDLVKLESGSYLMNWTINRAIMKPEMGIQFRSTLKTEPLQLQAVDILHYTPRGSMLLGIMVVLTMLICGISMDLGKLLLLLSIYSGQFLALIGLDLIKITYPFSLPVVSLFTLWVVSIIYRGISPVSRRLVLILTLLFSLGYPLAGLLPDGPPRTAFDAIVQSAFLLYAFGLSLYTRVKSGVRFVSK